MTASPQLIADCPVRVIRQSFYVFAQLAVYNGTRLHPKKETFLSAHYCFFGAQHTECQRTDTDDDHDNDIVVEMVLHHCYRCHTMQCDRRQRENKTAQKYKRIYLIRWQSKYKRSETKKVEIKKSVFVFRFFCTIS